MLQDLGTTQATEGRVLVVDDDGEILSLVAKFLRGNGFVVSTARNCRVALKGGHPQFVWCRGSIRALSKFGPARPCIARFKVFNRLIWPSA